jgi:1,2-diacylglycerol 3-alpha-glucosyltransferase
VCSALKDANLPGHARTLKIAVLFDNFGPYHVARLRAAAQVCTLLAIQARGRSREYGWKPSMAHREINQVTLDPGGAGSPSSRPGQVLKLRQALREFSPDCVFVPGWSNPLALAALAWCTKRQIPAVIMSESMEPTRSRWQEWVKRRIVTICSAGLVGGRLHTEYLNKLGMPRDRILEGYDVVDNHYFRHSTQAVRTAGTVPKFRLPQHYFLASARFIPRKNLALLIEAYARYRAVCCQAVTAGDLIAGHQPWSLIILGDGSMRTALERRISELQLDGRVLLPGFKQYSELPVYYGSAEVFIHAAISEPWGLVVNEAMASGLPVLVSESCGCAVELVHNGQNGFQFDPANSDQLASLMIKMEKLGCERANMGRASVDLIGRWAPDRFGQGLKAAAEKAFDTGVPTCTAWQSCLLQLLLRR